MKSFLNVIQFFREVEKEKLIRNFIDQWKWIHVLYRIRKYM